MNLFRWTGDMCHLISIVIFLHVVCWKKNASCVSLKSQILYLIVYTTRYLDLFTSFYSTYDYFMKLFFITSTAIIIYTIMAVEPTKSSYSATQDEFRMWRYAVGPSLLFAVVVSYISGDKNLDVVGFLWSLSLVLEATAMVPQLLIAHYNRHIQSKIKLAILCMGVYRLFYLFHWVFRSYTGRNYRHYWLLSFCGVLQVAFYSDFFYHIGCIVYGNCRYLGNETHSDGLDGNDMSSDTLLAENNVETEISLFSSLSVVAATHDYDEHSIPSIAPNDVVSPEHYAAVSQIV